MGISIQDLLDDRREVAIIWSIEDVKQVRPDLDDDQCWHVLQDCFKHHRRDEGFTYDLIDKIADIDFPPDDEQDSLAPLKEQQP